MFLIAIFTMSLQLFVIYLVIYVSPRNMYGYRQSFAKMNKNISKIFCEQSFFCSIKTRLIAGKNSSQTPFRGTFWSFCSFFNHQLQALPDCDNCKFVLFLHFVDFKDSLIFQIHKYHWFCMFLGINSTIYFVFCNLKIHLSSGKQSKIHISDMRILLRFQFKYCFYAGGQCLINKNYVFSFFRQANLLQVQDFILVV